MSVADTIRNKLIAAFSPVSLEVVDDSRLHAGHSGARPGGETHFRVRIVSASFAGCGRIERQRMVHRILADELAGPVHALNVHAQAPSGQSPV